MSEGVLRMLTWRRKMTRFGILICVTAVALGQPRSASAGPFEVREVDWEGYSGLFELARGELGDGHVMPLSELDWSELKPEDAILLIHPDHAISSDKLAAFLGAGGRAAVLDDFGAGDKILERFQIERVSAPRRPLFTLRRNPELAIAEPAHEPIAGHAAGVHSTVENVERLITNHPTGLRNPNLTPVLKIRCIDEPDVVLALAGTFGTPPRGKLFAMGDPSAFINQMLRYPGNRAFALGLIHYLVLDTAAEPRSGRLFIITNHFSESGTFAGIGSLKSELDNRLEAMSEDLAKVFRGGLSGILGLTLAALVAFGIGVWTTSVSSRVYRRRPPTFARPIPLVAQGGVAGRIAVLSAATTPRALAVLELKSALEEGVAHELGFGAPLAPPALLDEVKQMKALDERGQQTLKSALLEMSSLETTVVARQPASVSRQSVLRLAHLVFGLLATIRERAGQNPRAA
jgi:uncharacterized protein DUF4350